MKPRYAIRKTVGGDWDDETDSLSRDNAWLYTQPESRLPK